MEESVTYQAIISKGEEKGRQVGRVKEARRILLLRGQGLFGKPDLDTRAIIESADLSRVEEFPLRLMQAHSWREYIPRPRRRKAKS